MKAFSERLGVQPEAAEISIRHDAPFELRGVVVNEAYAAGLTPHALRSIVCAALQTREDPYDWTDFPNIDGEVRSYLDKCKWYEVYDIVEAIQSYLVEHAQGEPENYHPEIFAERINRFFIKKGVGWQLKDSRIEARGGEVFEISVANAINTLDATDRAVAANELHQALADLSRRPTPDVTGAIQHALTALECVARDVTGDPKSTFGAIVGRVPGLVPVPLDKALTEFWGFGS